MLTKTLADQIVRQCIREVVRTKQSSDRRATLGEMGVDSLALVALLRKAVLRELAARGFRMPSSGLVMNQRTVFAELVGKIAAQSMPLKKTHVAIKSRGPKPITKTALVRSMAKKLELTNTQTAAFLELLAVTAVKETKKIGEFTIPGIGKLVKAERKARLGRNPQTGESIKIKGKTVVKFRVAKVARDKIAPVKKPVETAFPVRGAKEGIAKLVTIRELANEGQRTADSLEAIIWREYAMSAVIGAKIGSIGTTAEKTGGKAAAPPMSPLVTVRATPQMEFAGETTVPNSYPLAVYLDQGSPAEGAIIEKFAAKLPKNLTECRVDVWMDCSPQLKLEGVTEDTHLTLNVANGVSDKLELTLKVVGKTKAQPMYVSAFFKYDGRPCGKIMRFLKWVGKRLAWKTEKDSMPDVEQPVPPGPNSPALLIEYGAEPADIRVEVTETALLDGRNYRLKCVVSDKEWEGLWTLRMKSQELVKEYMQSFMASKGVARVGALVSAGEDFWNLLPKKAKTLITKAIARGAKTMSVLSEEPYVPWELMVPNTTPYDAGEPLGITLQIGRWMTGEYLPPPQKVRLQSLFVISPTTSGLKSAADEVKFLLETLKDRWKPGDQLVPATVAGIDNGLAASSRDVLHFICHGKSGVLQTMTLEASEQLTSAMVRALKGFLAAFKTRPLVVLNSCEVGGPISGLDGISGFATSFMKLNASAVVAPLWAVQDKAALEVTTKFYPEILSGVPFAQVFQEIRKQAYTGDTPLDSYAAYCFYGDPLAIAVTA